VALEILLVRRFDPSARGAKTPLHEMDLEVRELYLSVLESAIETDDSYGSGIIG
jgi:hypothetical protein